MNALVPMLLDLTDATGSRPIDIDDLETVLMFAVPREQVVRVHASSGTTGRHRCFSGKCACDFQTFWHSRAGGGAVHSIKSRHDALK
jgi:hypothetical protein